MPSPDIAGFQDAQARLRAALGVDAAFIVHGEPVWPAGTPIDPESGKPFDPFLEPETAGVDAEITVRCSFVHRPLQDADPRQAPIGDIDHGAAALIVPADDYPQVANATRVRVGLETWVLEQWRYDIALGTERWIAYLEHA